jgi:hypothetical protein
MNPKHSSRILITLLFSIILACNFPAFGPATQAPGVVPTNPPEQPQVTLDPTLLTPPATAMLVVVHFDTPSTSPRTASLSYDVESSGTAAERRAPYGDSYDINRLERPFQQDMTYLPDLDVESFYLNQEDKWFYISMDLIGTDPNNPVGIYYGAELDTNIDGFGNYLIWAKPPYTTQWTNDNVQVLADNNHNTSGLSAEKSDAPFTADGYETLIFDGGRGQGDDPDLAWVRINAGSEATVQFAFKKSLAGGSFLFGVLADAGLKDPGKLDYVDRFTEEEAGSPVKDKQYYPLKALFAVDNTCREAYGFKPNGYEPMLCPKEQPKPTKQPGPTQPGPTLPPPPSGCPDPGGCPCGWVGEPWCMCQLC